MQRLYLLLFSLLGLLFMGSFQSSLQASEAPLRQPTVEVHALVGITLIPAPGERLENATLVVRNGIIEALGHNVRIPADARIHRFEGEDRNVQIYPGLIDAYVPVDFSPEAGDGDGDEQLPGLRPGAYPHPLITPARQLDTAYWPGQRVEALRSAGFTTAALAPRGGLFSGRAAIVNLGEGGLGANLIEAAHYQPVSLAARASKQRFPTSLMGTVALFRQALQDTAWQAAAQQAWRANPAQPRPAYLEGLSELELLLDGRMAAVFVAQDMMDSLRIADLSREFKLRQVWMLGHGREYQRLQTLAETGLGQILPLDFPDPPNLDGNERDISLPELRHWQRAPENPAQVVAAGLPVAFTSHPHSQPNKLFEALTTAMERGLKAQDALAALTTTPARLLGVEDRLGRLAPGYIANFLITEGELLSDEAQLLEVWVDGRAYPQEKFEPPTVEPAGVWDLRLTVDGMGGFDVEMELTGSAPRLSGSLQMMGISAPLNDARVSGNRLTVRIDGGSLGMPGGVSFTMDIQGEQGSGQGSTPMGKFSISGRRVSGPGEENRT